MQSEHRIENEPLLFRIPPDKRRLIEKVCETRGETLSAFIRLSVYEQLAKMGLLSQTESEVLLGGKR